MYIEGGILIVFTMSCTANGHAPDNDPYAMATAPDTDNQGNDDEKMNKIYFYQHQPMRATKGF